MDWVGWRWDVADMSNTLPRQMGGGVIRVRALIMGAALLVAVTLAACSGGGDSAAPDAGADAGAGETPANGAADGAGEGIGDDISDSDADAPGPGFFYGRPIGRVEFP